MTEGNGAAEGWPGERAAYQTFRTAWAAGLALPAKPSADDIDRVLHWGRPRHLPRAAQRAARRRGAGRKLSETLLRGEHLTKEDWLRTLLATEIVFASDVVGAGQDWSIATGLSDETTIKVLRIIQRKIGRVLAAPHEVG